MRFKKHGLLQVLYFICLMSLIFYAIPSYGVLRYQLLQAADSTIKIGFIYPKTHNEISKRFAKALQELNLTGEIDAFYLSDNPAVLNNSTSRRSYKDQSIHYIVLFSIQSVFENKKKIHVKCIRLKDKISQDQLLFENTQLITNHDILSLSYFINDKIYQAIMGHEGLFSTRIAFVAKEKIGSQEMQYQLKIANFDGSHEQTLYTSNEPIFSLAASPLGNIIAYTTLRAKRASIYFYNLTSGKKTQATHFSAIDNAPAFSPDGQQLVFVAEKNNKTNLFLMDINTHHIQQITDGYAIDTEPVFSKDRRSLVFTSNRDGSPQLYEYIFATQKTTRLTYEGNYNAHASFSKNDQCIVFMHKALGISGIAKMNLSSKALTILTATGKDQSPTVSPNGRMILYTTSDGKHRKALGLISLKGEHIRARLVSFQSDLRFPVWVPSQKMNEQL